ncbi:type 1 glutamine amidotransferase [Haloarchaeobius iranensis]|uniref:GMP synthase (Glutamine-hydrolysing) n=1 Tax=Haloarchaeobius iranensis TaxID=996166 RepID=A0A1G9ZLX1_9EURY|nr:type 1 glutamine amidotransferase [Haloarchaeobius iranensis]SDN22200.1 GMP synthase (glutamine-hydrolysing) [Haloarchaeobius iranensis]
MTRHVVVLDASLGETPAERNLVRELEAASPDVDIDVYKLPAGELPPTVASPEWRYDGVVVSGSQTAVYEDRDWIHEATAWVRRVHAADVPILGICWGHQFIAQALGGRVVDMGEYELGYREASRVGEDPLFDGIPAQFVSFETHSDRVAELPQGATVLARNDNGVQAYRVGSSYGLQFHPEYDRQTAVWVTEGKDLPEERIEQVRDGITDESVAAAEAAKAVFANFLELTASHQPGTSPAYGHPY